ncbi:crossover junction endonuclease MUS81 [Diaporthe amygdali]|uniref:crossover junction endonuclease MUS81 n=1 Tax=Phomopsis amygdali TaxID=1214568 RepID=UPI0022FE8A17|nr:crossover junction endonuclease MUS81 [Diaporthe amygdali]KAJ0121614.1 crossover junction endonuclease MUS81 [Diaporthe amygdali]
MPSDEDSPNPLLLSWVKEWYENAREKNTKGVTTYRKAYNSLKKCPKVFQHPSELTELQFFGQTLTKRLTDKLEIYCRENGLPMPERPSKSKKRKDASRATGEGDDDDDDDEEEPAPVQKKPRKAKPYVPAYRSGAYALIVALSNMPEYGPEGMAKLDLIDKAQPHCNSSFTASEPGSFYTAWNSMKTLLAKELVYERGRPTKRYALTEDGRDVARRIQEANEASTSNTGDRTNDSRNNSAAPRAQAQSLAFVGGLDEGTNDDLSLEQEKPDFGNVVTDGPVFSDNSSLPNFTTIRLNPGSFTVHLVLDVREIRAKTDRDYMQEELTKKGIKPIMRSLELGDAQWVAKCHDPEVLRRGGAEGDEVVLDYIVERKRLDDLIGSIKDGRFHEQKFRLKRSGVRHVTYLVEEISLDREHFSKYEESVQSAIASTQVVNGFTVKKTQKMDDTIRYLARMTDLLKKRYESQPLRVIPTKVITPQNYLPLLNSLRETQPGVDYYISYPAFASLVSKTDLLTLRDLFLKMLMCTRGVTGEKAIQIQKIWKTPNEFVKAFEQCGPGEEGKKRKRELVSSRLGGHAVKSKQIGKALSTKIAEVWAEV